MNITMLGFLSKLQKNISKNNFTFYTMNITITDIVKSMFEGGVDGVTFFPKNEFELDLRGFEYQQKSKYLKCDLGHYYHIMVYKLCDEGLLLDKDNFEAVLTDPCVYVSNLIKCGFYGVVVKKTKRSPKIIRELYAKFGN